MKELNIQIRIDELTDKIGTIIKHKGFNEGEGYTMEQILTTIGLLENLKQNLLKKLELKLDIEKGGSG